MPGKSANSIDLHISKDSELFTKHRLRIGEVIDVNSPEFNCKGVIEAFRVCKNPLCAIHAPQFLFVQLTVDYTFFEERRR